MKTRAHGVRRPTGDPLARARLCGHYRSDARYPIAIVNVTNRCNLACEHCFVYRDGNPNQRSRSVHEELAEDAILATLAALRDRHGIAAMLWMGGEPLLRRTLLDRGVRLFPRNTITTNGTVPLIDFGPDVLYVVSLDGPEDLNDRLRGAGTFRRVLRTLERLPDRFASPVQVQCVVTRRNETRLDELVQTLRGTRVGWVTFSFYVPRRGDAGEDAWPTNAERVPAVQAVMELKARYPGFVRNSRLALDLMMPAHATAVTDACPARELVLPLYLEADGFVTPYCCYGNDVDCERCGAWVVFHLAAGGFAGVADRPAS